MKTNKIIILLMALAFIGFTSCEKWLDINEDPNNPSKANPEKVLPAAIMSGIYQIHGPYAVIGGIWSQYWTQSNAANQYKSIETYTLSATDYNYAYDEMFSGALNDLFYIKKESEQNKNWNMFLIANTLQAYFYQVLVDVYDKVPYKEAFQGEEGLLNPGWDDGKFVYEELIKNIDNALSKSFSSTLNRENNKVTVENTDPGAQDLIFWPDVNNKLDQEGVENLDERMDHWVSFAYWVKIKLLLRMRLVDASKAESGIKDIIDNHPTELFIENIGINKFEEKQYLGNPLWQENIKELNVSTNLKASTTMMSYLKLNGDNRLEKFYKQGAGGNWVSLDQGDYTRSATEIDNKTVATYSTDPQFPANFFSKSELHFILAEIYAVLYSDPANAQTQFDAGIAEAYKSWGITTPTATYTYPSSGTVEEQLEAIIVQKWVALYGSHSLEAWLESNRTGYPKETTERATNPDLSTNPNYVPGHRTYSINGATSGLFPRRLVFPDSEKSRNKNTPALVPLTTKVWWSKQ